MVRIQDQAATRERDENARQREQTVYRLWLRGVSLTAIAPQVGYKTEAGARHALERYRERQADLPDLAEERHRSRQRLELLYAGIAERAERGLLLAIDRALKIEQRKADLLGLDAPKAVAVPEQTALPTVRSLPPDLMEAL